MTFVSIEFFIFLTFVFLLYHAARSVRLQNWIIAISSFVFYGFWDWRFLSLLAASAGVSYGAAILIEQSQSEQFRRFLLWATIAIALSTLGLFKYFNFFVENANTLLSTFGFKPHVVTLQIILPLGISFMTFQGLAYVIDVYRGQHEADRDLVRVFAFKAFFPQLVAGPIERAGQLLDQFKYPRVITQEKVQRAVWLMIYGFAMKIVIADSLAAIVDSSFAPEQAFGWSVVLATIAFGIQIYADFCGYSLIAKGTALLFGFDLIWNFRFPYWSVSITAFWRRWHIGLSNWLRDYLYIPLGGNRQGNAIAARNMLITMTLGGLWHGASWNFVLWGLLHGIALGLWRYSPAPTLPLSAIGRFVGWIVTMAIVFVGWFLFRAASPEVMRAMVSSLGNWEWLPAHTAMGIALLSTIIPLAAIEWAMRNYGDFFIFETRPMVVYPACAFLTVIALAMAGSYHASFIYFQF